jgi:hypothetical protein
MDERKVRSLVKGWHARAQQEDSQITRFVFLWFCFNARLAYESGLDVDRAMINWLNRRQAYASQLRAAFDQAMQSDAFISYVQALADLGPVLSNGRRPREPVRIDSLEDFAAITNCIYQVRCNLFHGSKRADDSRDQKLVAICAQILENWVGCLVADWLLEPTR